VARSCVFCGRGPVTAEDVFPRWLGAYLGRRPTYTVTGAGIGTTHWGGYRGLSMTARVKRVCKGCNNGWMSQLETAAAPILKPMLTETISVSLSGGATGSLSILAKWAMKTALMIQYAHRSPAIPGMIYQEFHRTQLPPPQCWMFLARHMKRGIPNGANSIQWRVDGPPGPRGEVTHWGEMYGTTFSIANLVVQLIGYVPTVTGASGTFQVDLPQASLPYVERLWPPSGSVAWPLQRPVLDDAGLLAFSRALTGMKATRSGLMQFL